MRDSFYFRVIRYWFISMPVAFIALIIPCQVQAEFPKFDKREWEEVNAELGVGYRYFIDEGMNEAYTGCFEFAFRFTARGEKILSLEKRDIEKPFRSGLRGEIGFIIAVGRPLQRNPDWEIIKSDLVMIAVPLTASYIYRLTNEASNSLVPYCGIGLGGVLGFERISAHIYRDYIFDEMHYEWHDTCYRDSFGGHACLGIYKTLGEQYGLLLEARWTHAGRGSINRGKLNAEQLKEGWGEVFEDFQHPDFNFTGPSVSLSLRW